MKKTGLAVATGVALAIYFLAATRPVMAEEAEKAESPFIPQDVSIEQAGKRAKASFSVSEALRKRVGNPIDKSFDFMGKRVYTPLRQAVNGFGAGMDHFCGFFQSLSQKAYDRLAPLIPGRKEPLPALSNQPQIPAGDIVPG